MPTPDFILELRERIGHMPLWLIGVTGYVRRDDGLVLLEQRTDNGKWTLVTGINEPGEEPADTVAREAKEETGVDVIVTDLVSVKSDRRMITYATATRRSTWITCSCAKSRRAATANRSSAMTKACASGGSRSTICPNRSATAHANASHTCSGISGTVRKEAHGHSSRSTGSSSICRPHTAAYESMDAAELHRAPVRVMVWQKIAHGTRIGIGIAHVTQFGCRVFGRVACINCVNI